MTKEAVRYKENQRTPSPAEELARIPLYEKGKPPQPLFDIDYMDELEATWGRRWGAQTELGKLRTVMVQKPTSGAVNSAVVAADPAFFGWPKGRPDLAAMTRNYESLVRILKAEGVEVVSLDAPDSVRGTYTELIALDAPREPVILNGGALIGRPGIAAKRGLEKVIAQRLMAIGCPILYMVHGNGAVFESGNVVWLDEKHVVIGCGLRTSMEGIAEVEPVLRLAGVEEIHIAHLPGYLNHWTERAGGSSGFYHLDMVFSVRRQILLDRWSIDLREGLAHLG
jgi:N-dimethylarginine dimethylaminohydrolase